MKEGDANKVRKWKKGMVLRSEYGSGSKILKYIHVVFVGKKSWSNSILCIVSLGF